MATKAAKSLDPVPNRPGKNALQIYNIEETSRYI